MILGEIIERLETGAQALRERATADAEFLSAGYPQGTGVRNLTSDAVADFAEAVLALARAVQQQGGGDA